MRRRGRDSERRVTGLGLKHRFVLITTLALVPVLVVAGFFLYVGATRIADNVRSDTISEAVRLTAEDPPYEVGGSGREHPTGVQIFPITYGRDLARRGTLYRTEDPAVPEREEELLVPDGKDVGEAMLGMIVAILVIVALVGAGVARWVAGQVTQPVRDLIDDVRQIAKGDLRHRTKASAVGEIQLLARAIDRMTSDLNEAQETKVELSVRERELGVAAGVREALLPLATPLVEGYDVGAFFLSSQQVGGDFHDFIELDDGRLGLLVCDVSGRGVPAALVGATARSYLRSELERSADVAESLRRVNRWLVADVRRGMFVTALYVLVDPAAARASVFCAGHKLPLLRYEAAAESLRVIHPEGIAFGFDKGPVFDRRLERQDVPLEPGDRLVLCNSAPVGLVNPAGRELGEKAFYGRVLRHASENTPRFMKALRRDFEQFVGEDGITHDVSLVTISREV